jgi:glycosyltransferase involved in cell wall biosynthesis
MKISICIPQYNRIDYLLENLRRLEHQTYMDIEVVISDDCSSDDTAHRIRDLRDSYKYPIVYHRNETNLGYDRNFRKSIELSSGEYAFVLGNDDSLNGEDAIQLLADFLAQHDFPEIGFCNMVEGKTDGELVKRASGNRILGSGSEVALQYYSCFSFVGGLIYNANAFRKFNSSKSDGSIYSQIYLGILMIVGGCRLFCMENALVIKDILLDDKPRGSYKDRLSKKWKDYKVVDGGLPSVIHVVITAFMDSGIALQSLFYRAFRRTYLFTFPYWIMDYRQQDAYPEAWGLFRGMSPSKNKDLVHLTLINRLKIHVLYLLVAAASLLMPIRILKGLYRSFYGYFKK